MRLEPLGDRVVLEREELATESAGGLVIPESASKKSQECRVVAVGKGARNERTGERMPMSVVVGDRVLLGPDSEWLELDGGASGEDGILVVHESEIMAVLG